MIYFILEGNGSFEWEIAKLSTISFYYSYWIWHVYYCCVEGVSTGIADVAVGLSF